MADAPVEVGEILAEKYRIEAILGQGGMGVVAAARHIQLDELVAIKFLLPKALEQPSLVARFNQEARAQIKVKSEHVARTIDVGTLETGAPYMVLEYLDGTDLAKLLRESGALSVSRTVDLILQACEALAEAHSLGIVHRDLKPANLFITRRADGSECLKVLDFGISKFTDGSVGEALDLTKTNMMLGSPLYMSPEQLRSAKHADARSDVWSLGIIMYQLLSDTLPFYEETVAQLCVSVMIKPLPDIHAVAPGVPSELKAAVEKAAAKELADRFANIAELAAAIAPFGGSDAQRSVGRVQRITAEVVSRAEIKAEPQVEPDLASTQVDGSGETSKRSAEAPDLRENLGTSDTLHSGPSSSPAVVKSRTPTKLSPGQIAEEGGVKSIDKPQPHTLDGTAEPPPAAGPAHRRLLASVAASMALLGGGLVFWFAGGETAVAEAPPGEPSAFASSEPRAAKGAVSSAVVTAAVPKARKPDAGAATDSPSNTDLPPPNPTSPPLTKQVPKAPRLSSPTRSPKSPKRSGTVRRPKSSGSVYGDRE